MDIETIFLILFIPTVLIIGIKKWNEEKSLDFLKSIEILYIPIYSFIATLGIMFGVSVFLYGKNQKYTLLLSEWQLNAAIMIIGIIILLFVVPQIWNYPEGLKIFTIKETRTDEIICPNCKGIGNTPCPNSNCKNGYIETSVRTAISKGKEDTVEECSRCEGKGFIDCKMCKGTGKIKKKRPQTQ